VALESKRGNQAIDADIDDYRQQNGKEKSARKKPAEKEGCSVKQKEHMGIDVVP
jgi:hypothetical protein